MTDDNDDDDDDVEYLRVVTAKNPAAKRQVVRFYCTTFLCDVTQCRSVENYQRFEGSCCLYFIAVYTEDRRMIVLRKFGIRL